MFILAMMLTYGTDVTLQDLKTIDDQSTKSRGALGPQENLMHPITVVNKKTFKGPNEYIGRTMPRLPGSPLGNPFKLKPHGPYERNEAVMKHYREWIWEKLKDRSGEVYLELLRLTAIATTKPLQISCWCAPEICHGDICHKGNQIPS